ncbi:MAG: GNAT family N-acetyltransferase [Eubacteriales bacterium]|nr:GNAT family N-acetyltransferase [Eubacteriales bacterium]
MIELQEIALCDVQAFWALHLQYLTQDEIICDAEELAYFAGREYRDILEAHMQRETDKHHMLYFVENGVRIGACQYTTYQSEDGKCFILDYWIFAPYRNKGKGMQCFMALMQYTGKDGARYYALNSTKPASIRFWKRLGFVECGMDEWGMKVFVKR